MMKVKLTGDIFAEYNVLNKAIAEDIKKKIVVGLEAATPVDTGEARNSWGYDSASIYNTADHISDLNKGSSQQAPSHFIERVVLSAPGVKSNGIIVQEV